MYQTFIALQQSCCEKEGSVPLVEELGWVVRRREIQNSCAALRWQKALDCLDLGRPSMNIDPRQDGTCGCHFFGKCSGQGSLQQMQKIESKTIQTSNTREYGLSFSYLLLGLRFAIPGC
jgi:hypothetical protein